MPSPWGLHCPLRVNKPRVDFAKDLSTLLQGGNMTAFGTGGLSRTSCGNPSTGKRDPLASLKEEPFLNLPLNLVTSSARKLTTRKLEFQEMGATWPYPQGKEALNNLQHETETNKIQVFLYMATQCKQSSGGLMEHLHGPWRQ